MWLDLISHPTFLITKELKTYVARFNQPFVSYTIARTYLCMVFELQATYDVTQYC